MSGPKQYREWNPRQSYLFPPSLQDWLPEDDLAYFIVELVETLDLSAIELAIHGKDPRGTRPYHPRMMTALLLYGYCVGVMSSRKIEQATHRDLAFRMIASGHHPDHSVIADFRQQHLEALRGLFLETVRLSQKAGLAKLGRVGLDGTKVQASASKHKAMSYERMHKSEAELQAEIAELLTSAERVDQDEDTRFGRGRRGDELPDELRRRQDRLRRIQHAKAELEAEAEKARADVLRQRAVVQRQHAGETDDPVERKRAATRAAQYDAKADELAPHDEDDDPPASPGGSDDALPEHQVPHTKDATPTAKAQRNFTDPDSRIMVRDGAYLQGYNGQAAVDDEHQIIVACGLSNLAPDQRYLPPLIDQIADNCGRYPDRLLADAGYWDESHIAFCEERNIDPYIATGKLAHGEQPPAIRGRPPVNLSVKGRMYRKLRTKRGRAEYARRKVIPEPVFGQIREVQGLRRFLLRGLDKVRAEWALICAAHNILKMHRLMA